MALAIANRVKETSATTGTGTLTLAGAVAQFQSFTDAGLDGKEVDYTIVSDDGTNWEVGRGTFTNGSASDTLSRDTVYDSSNVDSAGTAQKVSFAGTLTVIAGVNDRGFLTDPLFESVELTSGASNNVGTVTVKHTPGTGGFAGVDFLDLTQGNTSKRLILPAVAYGGRAVFSGAFNEGHAPNPLAVSHAVYISDTLQIAANSGLSFVATNDALAGTKDTLLQRNAAGVVDTNASSGGAGDGVSRAAQFRTGSFTVSTLPTANAVGSIIYVSDEAGGATLAFWNGSNWVRVQDLATVS